MSGRTAQLLRRASNLTNRFVAQRWGESFPFVYVVEYPKSGGTWLAKMIADVIGVPCPQRSIFPIGCASVLHNHWNYMRRLRRVVYLYRDGRDIVVSAFFHWMRHYRDPKAPAHREARAMARRLWGGHFDPDDSRGLLPRFIEDQFERPMVRGHPWMRHVESWLDKPHVAYVSYEQLRERPHENLKRVAEHAQSGGVEDWKVDAAVEKFSIERQTGRAAGQEDRKHFIRKGVVGDWSNHFSPEAARAFDERAGALLVRLGYEPDRSWVERCSAASAA